MKRDCNRIVWLASWLMCAFAATPLSGRTIHVDDDARGANNGTGWQNAYRLLQDALATARPGDRILVAQGTYRPDRYLANPDGTRDRNATFQLVDGVEILGGYAGVREPRPNVRDTTLYETRLSGDLGENDSGTGNIRGLPDEPTRADNAYHVVSGRNVGETAVLDGFKITGGNSNDIWYIGSGGGMYNFDASPTVVGCTFEGNSAVMGGAMSNVAGSPTVVDCSFIGNYAVFGGGIENSDSAAGVIDCVFRGNAAGFFGGGIHNAFSDSRISGCVFIENESEQSGGGIWNDTGNAIISKCTFQDNSANMQGGGVSSYGECRPLFLNCAFSGNSADIGGGLGNANGSVAEVSNCAFSGNIAGIGAGIKNDVTDITVINCTFSRNSASNRGGAMHCSTTKLTLTNSILWDNSPEELGLEASEGFVGYSNVKGGWPGENNIAADPLFADADGLDDLAGTSDDNLRLLSGSPCIDAGDNRAVLEDSGDLDGDGDTAEATPIDLRGDSRFQDDPDTPDRGVPDQRHSEVIDMGACEGPQTYRIILGSSRLSIPEGGTAACTVALGWDPQGTVEARIEWRSGDRDIKLIQPANGVLRFDSSNYWVEQEVTFTAAEDTDSLNGTADIRVSVNGLATAGLTVLELDNDPVRAVLFVDRLATGNNDGTSWPDAYDNLQAALDNASLATNPIEIRVAAGTYYPTDQTDPRDPRSATFQLVSGTAVYGGYAGNGGTDPDERDILLHETILSGDLARDDGPNFQNNDENCYHVVTCHDAASSTLIEGFTITGGSAGDNVEHWMGGGMVIVGGNPVVRDCRFLRNYCESLGFYPGTCAGGGMYILLSSPSLIHCTFSGNMVKASFTCIGGGIYAQNSSPILVSCAFSGNSAEGRGALYVCGGGMYNSISRPRLVNCTFSGNSSSGFGGGIGNEWRGSTLVNCSFNRNSAGAGGGATFNFNSILTLSNCILHGDSPDEIALNSSEALVSCSNVQGGWPGQGNIDSDPLFADPDGPDNLMGTEDDNLRLLLRSPCIDAGDNEADTDANTPGIQPLPGLDIDFNVRRFDIRSVVDSGRGRLPIVDMGAHEFGSSPIPSLLYVNDDAIGANVGTSWPNAFTDLSMALQTAFLAGERVTQIWVASGTYSPTYAPGNRETSFSLINRVAIYGGFAGNEYPGAFDLESRDFLANTTILTGDLYGNDGPGRYDDDENCYHVVTAANTNRTAILDGFRIVGGRAEGADESGIGAGLYIANGSPTIRNCRLAGNSSAFLAGGIYSDSSSPAISNLVIEENSAPVGEPDAGAFVYNNVDLQGALGLESGRLDLVSSLIDGIGWIDLDHGTTLNVTGSAGAAPTVIRADISGPGDIEIDAGNGLVVGGSAIVDMQRQVGDTCEQAAGGRIMVDGELVTQDQATIRNSTVCISEARFEGQNTIQNNNIRLREASLNYGGEFFVQDSARIVDNYILSEGDRYLDMDPDPSIPGGRRPVIENNKVTVVIRGDTAGSQGTLLELRARDYDCGYSNSANPTCASGAFEVPADSNGFTDDPSDNWVLEKLILQEKSRLNLTNRQGFEFQDFGDSDVLPWETVYVRQLVMGPDSVLNTALQTLYYAELVDTDGNPLERNLADPLAPLPNGARFEDIPLLGFSLGIIAMDDQTPSPHNEFDVRVRKRLDDPQDDPPTDPQVPRRGVVHRINVDSGGPADPIGVMEMGTLAPGYEQTKSVAAKGAFARAGDENIAVEFEYMFLDDAAAGAELIVYLSDHPEVSEHLVEIARVYPPASGPGSAGSGQFLTFSGLFPKGELNFTRGTYVELELRGLGARVWIDNWDPMIFCNTCCDFNAFTPIDLTDYYLMLTELGLADPTHPTDNTLPKGCLDLITDGCITSDDLSAWGALYSLTDVDNLCPWEVEQTSGAPVYGAESILMAAADPAMRLPTTDKAFCLTGKSNDLGNVMYGWDPEAVVLDSVEVMDQSYYSRLISDLRGNVYQLVLNKGLVGPEGIILKPKEDVLYEGDKRSLVTVGFHGWNGTLLMDAAFDPEDPNFIYVAPVRVDPNNGQGDYFAAAQLHLTGYGNWDLIHVYGQPPTVYSSRRPTDNTYLRSFIHNPDYNHLCEIEADPGGKYVFVLNRCWYDRQNYVLIYDRSTGACVPYSPGISAPANMVVSRREGKLNLYLSDSARTSEDRVTTIHHFILDETASPVTLIAQSPIYLRCPQAYRDAAWAKRLYETGSTVMVTSMAQDSEGLLYAVGYTAPRFNSSAWGPNIGVYSFTRPWLAIIAPGETNPLDAFDISSWNTDNPPTLPLSIAYRGR